MPMKEIIPSTPATFFQPQTTCPFTGWKCKLEIRSSQPRFKNGRRQKRRLRKQKAKEKALPCWSSNGPMFFPWMWQTLCLVTPYALNCTIQKWSPPQKASMSLSFPRLWVPVMPALPKIRKTVRSPKQKTQTTG